MSTTVTGTIRDGFSNLFNGTVSVAVANQANPVAASITNGALSIAIPVPASGSVKALARFFPTQKNVGSWHEQWTVYDSSLGMTHADVLSPEAWLANRSVGGSTPSAHASTHASAQSDAITIAESQVTNLPTDLAAKQPLTLAVNAQTGTTYTLLAADKGKVVLVTNAADITLTVPAGLLIGFHCRIVQGGAGKVTPTAADGVTITQVGSLARTKGAGAVAHLIAVAANSFVLYGDLEAGA